MSGGKAIADALNRVADALFQQAKAQREQVKVQKDQLAVAEELKEMQKANLAVTKYLESELAARAMGDTGGSA